MSTRGCRAANARPLQCIGKNGRGKELARSNPTESTASRRPGTPEYFPHHADYLLTGLALARPPAYPLGPPSPLSTVRP
jgi:hypothetical protein